MGPHGDDDHAQAGCQALLPAGVGRGAVQRRHLVRQAIDCGLRQHDELGAAAGGQYGRYDYGTVAYRAFSGARLWVRRYNGPGGNDDFAVAIAAGPGRVFLTGESFGAGNGRNNQVFYATVAYRG